MVCPKCKSENIQAISQVETTSSTKGFGFCKGALGAIIFGPVGWFCGLCGMGKGKSKTSTSVLWVCSNCGNKFK